MHAQKLACNNKIIHNLWYQHQPLGVSIRTTPPHQLSSTQPPSQCQKNPCIIQAVGLCVQIAARLKARLRCGPEAELLNARLHHAFLNNENTLLGQCPVNPGIYLGSFIQRLRTNKSRPLNSLILILLLSVSFTPTYFLPLPLSSRV